MRGDLDDEKRQDNRITLDQYREALGLARYQFLEKIGEPRASELLRHAERGRPIAAVKAEAICTFLSKEFKRTIRPGDIKDLKLC